MFNHILYLDKHNLYLNILIMDNKEYSLHFHQYAYKYNK